METKKARLQDDFGIAMTEEFESEVQDMCNLGKALVEQGIEQGIVKGIEQGMEQGVEQKNLSLAEMMLKDKEPIDKIKKYTGFATDKLEEIAKSMGMTLRNMVVEMHAFNRTSEDEKKVFISYNLFYYRLAVLLYPRTSRPVLSRYLSREESRLTEHPVCTIYHQPLPDSTGGFGICMDVTAVYPARITECFHGSCISGTLRLSIYQCTPGCICIIILPSPVCISTIAAEIIKSSQDFIII